MAESGPRDGAGPRTAAFAAFAALLLVAVVACFVRSAPPRPVAGGKPGVFSTDRALALLDELVGDGIPHPVGSAHNAVVRERVIGMLRRIGLEPEVQVARAARPGGPEVTVRNVLARLPGRGDGPAVMLSAHYDSVASGPGASDDGVGVVAVLEVARLLAADLTRRNDVVVLITDGEEAGLLGARAFVADHPWADEVGAVINLEARGTSGPGLLFQTSDESAWLIDLFAEVVRRPFTGSLFVEVYERMPNDTDFTIFRDAGMAGYNLAFIGDVVNYHTERDDLAHVSPASLGHHGTQTLGLARRLADADLSDLPAGRAVYFDLLSTVVVRWPLAWCVPLAAGGTALLTCAVGLLVRRERVRPVAMLATAGLVPVVIATAAVAGLTAGATLPDAAWPEAPFAPLAALWLAAATCLAGATLVAPGRLDGRAWWAGVWMWWSGLSVAAAIVVAPACYLLLVPAVAAGLVGAAGWGLAPSRPLVRELIVAVPILAVILLWVPLDIMLYDALGLSLPAGQSARAAMMLTPLAPALAASGTRSRCWVALSCLLGTVAAVAISGFSH